ncbi:MAG: hypothetical protein IT324_05280 [Anaerolineae bacterium]|nr:hypothetical protein [Anaerolineae bacterium]
MGTYAIMRMLWRQWSLQSHPIYRYETRHATVVPQIVWPFVRRVWRPLSIISAVIVTMAIAEFLCGGAHFQPLSLVTMASSLCFAAGGIAALSGILILIYVWPLPVAIIASGAIVDERERQTWDTLLTVPMERSDLLLVKLASILNRLNPYGEVFLWMQFFLLAIIFVLVVGLFATNPNVTSADAIIEIPLLALTLAEFGIARVQDYVMSALIGLAASLVSSTRQAAISIAALLTLAMILARALVTAFMITRITPPSPPATLILIATGPSSVVTLALPPLLAIVALLTMLLVREGIIRLLFHWLTRHMGEAPEWA